MAMALASWCYSDEDPFHPMYESGIALMTLASSRCPDCIAATGITNVLGRRYLDIAQDMVITWHMGKAILTQG